jgi:hypothetical protein
MAAVTTLDIMSAILEEIRVVEASTPVCSEFQDGSDEGDPSILGTDSCYGQPPHLILLTPHHISAFAVATQLGALT